MKLTLTPEQTRRFNALIWAFDAATLFKHDRVTNIDFIIRLAMDSHLNGIAFELQDMVALNSL